MINDNRRSSGKFVSVESAERNGSDSMISRPGSRIQPPLNRTRDKVARVAVKREVQARDCPRVDGMKLLVE